MSEEEGKREGRQAGPYFGCLHGGSLWEIGPVAVLLSPITDHNMIRVSELVRTGRTLLRWKHKGKSIRKRAQKGGRGRQKMGHVAPSEPSSTTPLPGTKAEQTGWS
ncbi:hypothetical protein EYF80_013451 [Liparis tanakae]|uniref:Uncharacterized protein n=1 Tax=Liparis tanakae TaxID=230148 RepID=A0A4Z2IGF1_9TELE|nr:hypothetical protein EYF80_013451 [Liparis tanakae]